MKTRHIIALTLPLLLLAATAFSQVDVAKVVFCRQVQEREPVEPANSFPADIGWVYCHTTVANNGEPTEIHHDWYYQDAYITRITLPVGTSPAWRTYSAKRMSHAWLGKWEVVVRSAEGKELKRASFTVAAPAE